MFPFAIMKGKHFVSHLYHAVPGTVGLGRVGAPEIVIAWMNEAQLLFNKLLLCVRTELGMHLVCSLSFGQEFGDPDPSNGLPS